MRETPIGDRIRISFFGRRNVGKSSLINAISNQNLSIISDYPGTTTDPVSKTMEILPLGPVVLTDTAGIDDEGDLGILRIEKTREVLNKTDVCIVVCDINQKDISKEIELIEKIKSLNKPYIFVVNKDDNNTKKFIDTNYNPLFVSSVNKLGIEELKNKIGSLKINEEQVSFLEGIASENKIIVLVCPIDESAPKNRLIMPQVMAIRDILDKKGICISVVPSQLERVINMVKPDLVITDSQAFKEVNEILPVHIPLTSFSVLMAKFKGDLEEFVKGADLVDNLQNGDKILIAEACTHHAQKNDIGRVQIPNKLKKYTGKDLIFDYISGISFPDNLNDYKLIIHCGGCMISRTMMIYRQNLSKSKGVPMTNYGVLLAKLNGIKIRF